jgi:hypothetical protein
MLKRQYEYSIQLQTLKNTFLVNNNINKVWEFYTDINHPKIITPKEITSKSLMLQIKFSQGTEIWIEGKNNNL